MDCFAALAMTVLVVPALSRDPYRVIYRLSDVVDTFRNTGAGGYGSRRSPGRRELGAASSRISAVFAEQIELLLHRAIGKTEQHGILIRLVGDPLPAWHHEQIARTPLEGLLADPRTSTAFDRRDYRGVGRAVARGLEAL